MISRHAINSFSPRRMVGLLVSAWLAASMMAAPAPTEVAQMLLQRHAAAIVEVNIVLAVSGTVGDKVMPPRESKLDTLATVISPDGLAVVSLASIDPSEAADGMRVNTPRGPMRLEVTSVEFKVVRLRFPDGTDVAAQVVLKDPDLDVAFLRPIASVGRPLVHVDLAMDAWPQILSTGYILSRAAPRTVQSAPLVRRVDIISVTENPRRRIVPETGLPSCPVFDASGKIYGLCVRQYARGRPTGDLVLPAKELAEIAAQAAAIKMEPVAEGETKPEA